MQIVMVDWLAGERGNKMHIGEVIEALQRDDCILARITVKQPLPRLNSGVDEAFPCDDCILASITVKQPLLRLNSGVDEAFPFTLRDEPVVSECEFLEVLATHSRETILLFLSAMPYNTSLRELHFKEPLEEPLSGDLIGLFQLQEYLDRNIKLGIFKTIEKKILYDDEVEESDLAACDFEFIDKTILDAESLPESRKKQSYLSELQRLRTLALAVRDDNVEMKLSALSSYLPAHRYYGIARARMYDFYFFSQETVAYKTNLQACFYAMQSRDAGCVSAPDIDFLLHEIKLRIFKLEDSSFTVDDPFVAGLKLFLIDYIRHERQYEGTEYGKLNWPILIECLSEPLEVGLAEMESCAKRSGKNLSDFFAGYLFGAFQEKFKLAFDEKTSQIQELKLQQALADLEGKLKQVISQRPSSKHHFSQQQIVAFMEDVKRIADPRLQPAPLKTAFKAFKKTHQTLWDSVSNNSKLRILLLTILSCLHHPIDKQARKCFRRTRRLNAASLFFRPFVSDFRAVKDVITVIPGCQAG